MEGKINMNLNEISKDHLFCDGWEFSKIPLIPSIPLTLNGQEWIFPTTG